MLYSQRGNRKNKNKVRQHHSFKTNKQNCSGYFSKAICFYPLPCQFPNTKNVANPNRSFKQSRPKICRSVIQLRFYPTVFDINLIKEKEMCYKFITDSAPFLFLLLIHKRNVSLYMNKCLSQVSYKGIGEQNLHKKIHFIVSYQLPTVISSDALETVSTALNYFNTALCWQF